MKLNKNILSAIKEFADTYHISDDVIFKKIEEGIAKGYRNLREAGPGKNSKVSVSVTIDHDSGTVTIEEKGKGPVLVQDRVFGRTSAQTVRAALTGLIAGINRDTVYQEFKAKTGSLVPGTIVKSDERTVLVRLDDRPDAWATLPKSKRREGDTYEPGKKMWFRIQKVVDRETQKQEQEQEQGKRRATGIFVSRLKTPGLAF